VRRREGRRERGGKDEMGNRDERKLSLIFQNVIAPLLSRSPTHLSLCHSFHNDYNSITTGNTSQDYRPYVIKDAALSEKKLSPF